MEKINPTQPNNEQPVGHSRVEVSTKPKEEVHGDPALELPCDNPELEIARQNLLTMEVAVSHLRKRHTSVDTEVADFIEKIVASYTEKYKKLLEGSSFDERESFMNSMEIQFPLLDSFMATYTEYADDPERQRAYIDLFIKRTMSPDE